MSSPHAKRRKRIGRALGVLTFCGVFTLCGVLAAETALRAQCEDGSLTPCAYETIVHLRDAALPIAAATLAAATSERTLAFLARKRERAAATPPERSP